MIYINNNLIQNKFKLKNLHYNKINKLILLNKIKSRIIKYMINK